jgi:hypothetical protein
MNKGTDYVTTVDLESLIDELMKANPNQVLVKSLMQRQGIPYSEDPLQQMNQVLLTMNEKTFVKKLKEKESSI